MALQRSGTRLIEQYTELPASWVSYDVRFPAVAARVGSLVHEHMPSVSVEHIGSTAVPGCGGKGVVDVMIVCASNCLELTKDALAALGFQPQSTRDPFPESRPMRVGTLRHEGQIFRIHAHILTLGAPEAETLVAFRDRLRADPALRAEYEACKQTIVTAGVTDSLAYCEAKSRFFQGVGANR